MGGYEQEIIVPINLSNPENSIGGFQFDFTATPNIIQLSSVTASDPNNFSVDFNIIDDTNNRVIFYSNNGGEISSGGDQEVMFLHFDGSEILSAVVNIEPSNLTISDGSGNIINGSIDGGSITIGDVVVMLSLIHI